MSSPSLIFSINDPATVKLPSQVYVKKNTLIAGGWANFFKRCFIPKYASAQDKKVTEFFTQALKGFIHQELQIDKAQASQIIGFAEQHIARYQSCLPWVDVEADIARLAHYTLALRKQLHDFSPSYAQHPLSEKCRKDNRALLDHWIKLGFSEETFWNHPDLVDFIFKAHLHRHITHPYYKHTIPLQNCLVRRHGQLAIVSEPHLLMNGRFVPWAEIRKRIHLDGQAQLYSIEQGRKRKWTYLEQGLVLVPEDNFARPHPLRKLEHPPANCQVQIVTTHAHKQNWNILDRILKGSRHSFLRIIPGASFSQRHPEMGLESGAVYSFGWGTQWRDFNLFSPLTTLRGKWCSPDDWEFLKQDHCVTTLDVTEAQLTALMSIIRRRSNEEMPFHFVTANCTGITAEVLNEAGILDVCTKNHMSRLSYELLMPKCLRIPLDWISSSCTKIMPSCLSKAFYSLKVFLYSLIFAPLFSLLGAWRTKITYTEEAGQRYQVHTANRIKALFSNIFDFFNSDKMQFDMTRNIYKWQKTQLGTTYETRD